MEKSYKKIAENFDVSESGIGKIIKKYNLTG